MLLFSSIGRGFGARKRVNSFGTGNPFLGTKLLGFSTGRSSGAPKRVDENSFWGPSAGCHVCYCCSLESGHGASRTLNEHTMYR